MNRRQALKLYIASIGCLSAAVLAFDIFVVLRGPTHFSPQLVVEAAFFVVLAFFSSRRQVYWGDSNSMAMGTIPHVVILLVLPLTIAIPVIALAKVASETARRLENKTRSWRAIPVNVGGVLLAITAAGTAFHLLRGDHYLWDHGVHAALALPSILALGVLYFFIDVFVILVAVSLNSRDPVRSVFRSVVRDKVVAQFSLILVGVVFAVLWHTNPLLSFFIVVPVVLSMRSFEAVSRLRDETIQAVLRVAQSIDIRDKGTGEHSDRLAAEAKRLAVALGLVPEHAREIELAARVHDLGKIGISNEILLKNGPLTPQEREIMQDHPVIGANILGSYSAFQSSVEIVRHHHERWDGKGYPDGIKGDDIPIGSRIISVVDAFDAMTEDRPYRKGMSVAMAVSRLKDGMGTQFDPRICAAYIQLLIEDGAYVPPEPVPELRLIRPDDVTPVPERLTAAK